MVGKVAPPSPGLVARTRRFLGEDVWQVPPGSPLKASLYRLVRILLLTIRGFYARKCLSRAAALTYVTVLSLVPLLAFAFSIAKGFGAYDALRQRTIDPFLDETYGKLERGAEVRQDLRQALAHVLDFVDRSNLSNLGLLGLVLLVYMVIRLLSSVEDVFNDIWEVKLARSPVRRVTDYLAIAIIAPVALITATGVTAAAQNSRLFGFLHGSLGLGGLIALGFRLVPLLAVWIGFTFLYLVMPNARVRWRSALLGGLVAGTLWQLAQIAHIKFQLGVANYDAVYAGFAVLPIFLVWLYASWVVVLLGAQLAAAHQREPRYRGLPYAAAEDPWFLDFLGLRVMVAVGEAFLAGRPAYRLDALADGLRVPGQILDRVVTALAGHGVLATTGNGRDLTFLPARDLELISVKNVLVAVRGGDGSWPVAGDDPRAAAVLQTLVALDGDLEHSTHNVSLKQLVKEMGTGATPGASPAVSG